MHFEDAADLSPLSYGAGLALGLMLILGLPRATDLPQTSADRPPFGHGRVPIAIDDRAAPRRSEAATGNSRAVADTRR